MLQLNFERENRNVIEPVPVIQHSDPSLVFVFLLCFAIATIFFSFMVSTFFNKVHFAVPVGGFIYLATYFPATRVSSNYAHMTLTQKLASCLSSNVAMALGTKFLVKAEMDSIGIKWSNIFSPTEMDNFVFAHVLGMFLVDAFLYGLVAWYIEAVFPGEYGVPKPWNFFLLCSHWFGEIPEKKNETRQFYEIIESKYFEAEPTDLVAGIRVKHLCKEFRVQNTTKMAVKDLSLNLYEGQITVLLGHNGAGKSTTLSLLSGLYPSTSGEAYVNGYDISKHMVQIRKSLGLCPQQDLLFNYLTVSEHLYFYCVLKGIPPEMRRMEIDRMLSAFNLLEKRDALSQSLSGGMKRRLSIIIALIGGSKVVILDEPTSGMDPASRRAAWSLLQHYKQDRTILLTTHYMDEADVLGDRIAIMVKGSLRCCGSSVFLKKIYGVGYHIVMVKEPHCDVEEISKLINYYIPTATLEKNFRNELSFILPKEYTHRFEALFTNLEKRQKELGIASFGASITTMEEVFFRVSNMEDSQTDIQATQPQTSSLSEASVENQNVNMSRNERADSSAMNESPAIMFNTGYSLYQQQFRAMFIKRILALLGSFTFLSAADKFSPNNEDEKARLMDLGQYGQTIVPLSISGNSNLTQIFLKHLKSMLVSEKQTLKEVQGDLLKYLIENEDCIHLCIVAFSIEVKRNEITFTALFNNQAYHSPSLTLAMLDNILFMSISGPDASLTVSNKPQPHSRDNERSTMITNGHQVALNIHFGIALLISGFCLLTVTERVSKAKHIQFVSGVYVLVYWLSALLWDFIIFFITCCLLLGVCKYCQLDIYVTDYHFLDTMLIFMLFGWSAIPLMYLLSFLFTRSTSAYIKLVLFNYLSGIFSLLIDAAFQFEVPHSMSNATRTFVRNSLLLFPNYNLAKCIADYFTFYQKRKWCSVKIPPGYLNCSQDNTAKNIYSLEEEMIGKYMIMMSTTGFIFLLLLFFLETTLWKLRTFFNQYIYFGIYKTFRKEKVSKELSGESEDEDVQNERKRILGQSREQLNSTVLIKELTKIYFNYPVILAVKNISVTIQKGECFGLLGFNGAGKTTTFQILTGEESVTSGNVFIDGFSITENVQELAVKQRELLKFTQSCEETGDILYLEHVDHIYTRRKEVEEIEEEVTHDERSGGSKRRLSTAIALMGKPSVILLDEPSTGMDPVARRLLWDAVIRAQCPPKENFLALHLLISSFARMEECDAFCTKLAIMVQGKFMCLGSPQHLKNKFGNVYILKIKVKFETCEDKLNDLKFLITTTFPADSYSPVKETRTHSLTLVIYMYDFLFHVACNHENSEEALSLPSKHTVFGILEEVKEQFNLDDYSISQITLEQVFLTFANLQNTEDYKDFTQERRKRQASSTLKPHRTHQGTIFPNKKPRGKILCILTISETFSTRQPENFSHSLNRRQFINLIMEVFTALMFPMMLLLFRIHIHLKILGPYNFTSQPISTLPSFLKNPEEWELIYLPSNIDVVKEITENVKRNLNISIKVRGFSSETEFEKYIKYDYESRQVLAAIVFDHDFKNSNDPLPLQVKYHLRFVRIQRTIWWPDKVGWKTSLLFPVRPSVGPRNPDYDDGGSPGYIREGFLAVQHALDKAVMLYHESSARKKLFDGISVFVQRFPHPAYAHDRLIVVTSSFFPLMFIFMFSPTVLSIVRSIVWEREKGLKIFNEPIFRYSDYSFIFVFLMCYAIASIFFGFMVSTFFSKARVAASAGSLLYFASFFPFNAIAHYYGQITLAKKVAACLSSNVVLALGINHLLKLEIRGNYMNCKKNQRCEKLKILHLSTELLLYFGTISKQNFFRLLLGGQHPSLVLLIIFPNFWDNLWTPATLEDNFVFGYMLGMLLLDAFLYGLVTWYVETVFPGQYGVAQPWYFFFMEFGDKVAVNNMSLNLYKGQITILLGQNGAGKTTTLSILTGRYPPTRGEAYINGYDISKNIVEIQKNLSFCPQHDLLFNNLTLSEHLFFYSVVKRRYQKMCPVEIDQILSTLNLLEKRDTFSKSLSEGMKRKLSIIIALLGDSQVVILDEPSSSVDPISRRAIWDLLQQKKHNRTILMTTHYMDEADILGDRIAIMVKGTLQCCGSSVFLKQIYGAGYHIVLEREPHCDVEKISAMIQSHIPDATLENCLASSNSKKYYLNKRICIKDKVIVGKNLLRFEALFNDLEKKQKELGIASLGASITTMEEVFLNSKIRPKSYDCCNQKTLANQIRDIFSL
ncbi:hypothetical protein HPG69_005086 [Diceros bicornis minor]|uniref:ABC transporter domain-containing protein n=1 Tax=Diceros bicornis minor TaxID=77932 RepID=A0A7J7EFP2_DICBM|nr:hypothetical protein HPG69_005086 [Diceros bicornis minor]